MASELSTRLEAFTTKSGHVVRLTGRGSMLESRVFHRYSAGCLEAAPQDADRSGEPYLTLDLSACPRLDSTFLGCLVDLHKRFNRGANRLFALAAPPPVRKELLGACRLDRLLPVLDEAPIVSDEGRVLFPAATPAPRELGEHVMECHLRLVEQDCPGKKEFASVAERLEKELAGQR
jgi:anti-anti-sigma regulatory factor